jgi:hypothetical protein
MAYKLAIVATDIGVNMQVKYENLAKQERPEVEAKAPGGIIVKERTVYQGTVLAPGMTQRKWVDDQGKEYAKASLTFWYKGEQVSEISQTKVFEIQGYQDLKNYTDSYVIGKYYEVMPSDNDMKKDIDKEMALRTNLSHMRKLFEHLKQTNKVARGEFNASSRGFLAGDGFVRAIEFGNKWGLEIGVFTEEKVFEHLNEDVRFEVPTQTVAPTKRIKMV